MAFCVFSLAENAVRRIYPSPLGPKPAPGVVTTPVLFNISLKKSHEPMFFGALAQIYGAFSPPLTESPAADNAVRIIFAFSR